MGNKQARRNTMVLKLDARNKAIKTIEDAIQKRLMDAQATLNVISLEDSQILTPSFNPNRIEPSRNLRFSWSAKPRQKKTSEVEAIDFDINPTNDQRIRYQFTNTFPRSVHGVIKIETSNANECFWGTGIMIGPELVLTAAHNLYDDQKPHRKKYSRISFYPAMNEDEAPFGKFDVDEFYVPASYILHQREGDDGIASDDYGLLVLKHPIGEKTGFFGLHVADQELLKGKEIQIIGYPGDKVKEKPETYEQWGMKGTVLEVDEDRYLLHYDLMTSPGQDGSGVFYEKNQDQFYVVGLHVGVSTSKGLGTAIWMTKERLQTLQGWIKTARQRVIDEMSGNIYENVKELNLETKSLEDLGVQILSSYKIRNLQILDLESNSITWEGAVSLGRNLTWKNLQILNLRGNNIGDKGIVELAKNTTWTKLHALYLYDNSIGSEGIELFSKNATWKNLQTLDLSYNSIGDKGVTDLAKNSTWPNLQVLYLRGCSIGDKGVAELKSNSIWTQLQSLFLSRNNITDRGATELSKNTSWPSLAMLDLQNNGIGSEGALDLSTNPTWKSLHTLSLSSYNWVNPQSLELARSSLDLKRISDLSKNVRWTNLQSLNLSMSFVTILVLDLAQSPRKKVPPFLNR